VRHEVLVGDSLSLLQSLEDERFQCCVTSPPYWGLRHYGAEGEIGREQSVQEYVDRLVAVFSEVRRVLRSDGTLWLNIGDTYTSGGRATFRSSASSNKGHRRQDDLPRPQTPAGLKPKELVGVPWRLAFALQADGWYLRSDIIWHKPNQMPDAAKDRPTKAHEYIFLLAKSERYYFDRHAIMEKAVCQRKRGPSLHKDLVSTNGNGGLSRREPEEFRNGRTLWSINTASIRGQKHSAVFPRSLAMKCIRAGSRPDDEVLDPFVGSGTTLVVARQLGRSGVGIELSSEYADAARKRIEA
jgi:site-specific DNA-methyltransferase (adenine-specific)/site-specific DNA-methyltransferase (cytosine-N4-specific)